jgi:hypothetical protein
MNPKKSSGRNQQSDYARNGDEFDKAMEEFEKPFKEFEYEMNEMDRINAEFEESMKIPGLEEYEKDFEKDFSFADDPGRYKRHIEMLIRSCGISPSEFYQYIRKRISRSKFPNLSDY